MIKTLDKNPSRFHPPDAFSFIIDDIIYNWLIRSRDKRKSEQIESARDTARKNFWVELFRVIWKRR